MIEFPKWIYHKTLEAKVVQSNEEQIKAGPEWKETPAYFLENNSDLEPVSEESQESEVEKTEAATSKKKRGSK